MQIIRIFKESWAKSLLYKGYSIHHTEVVKNNESGKEKIVYFFIVKEGIEKDLADAIIRQGNKEAAAIMRNAKEVKDYE